MISSTDHLHFNCAQRLAEFGQHRVRVGCVAAIGRKRLAGSFNTYRNMAMNVDWNQATRHAEVNCMYMVPWEKKNKTTLYVARIGIYREPRPSFPCEACMDAIVSKEFKAIVYMNDAGEIVKEKL
jgi:deoxycytidylate deaminase